MVVENFYSQIASSNKKVSRIILGMASSPYVDGTEQNNLLDEIFAKGITAFDTARQYRNSEECLGKWMSSRKNRQNVFVLTKCAHPFADGKGRLTKKDIRSDAEDSLKELKTDYIDALMLHRDDASVPVGEVVEWCNELIREGLILSYGCSNWKVGRIAAANEYARSRNLIPFALSSPHFSLAEQFHDPWGGGCVTITGAKQKGERDWYRASGMPVVAYSSLGRGIFSGKVEDDISAKAALDHFAYLGYGHEKNYERTRRCKQLAKQKGVSAAQIALSWVFHSGINVFAVVGSSSVQRIEENIHSMQVELSEKEYIWLNLEEEK